MNTYQLLNIHMKGSRGLYAASWIAIAVSAFFSLLQPQIIRVVLDVGIGGEEWTGNPLVGRFIDSVGGSKGVKDLILPAAGLSVLLMALSGVFLYLKGRWSAAAAEDTARRMRDRLYSHLQNMDYEYHVKANTGDLIQRCTSDVETVRSFLATQAVEIGRGVFLVAMTASLMSSLNDPLTWVSMSVFPAIFGFGYVFFLRVKHVFGESDESEGRMSASLQENITGIRVVRAFARKDHEMAKFDENNRDFRDKTYRLIRLLAWYWSISDLLCFTQIGLVMSVGGLWAAQGRLSLGTAVVFFTYVGRLLWPVRQMGRILTEMGKSTVALRRIQEVLDTPPELKTGGFRGDVTGAVEFRGVGFRYGNERPVLRNLSFRVEPGEIVALLGATGSGKSTLAHLIPRLYDPSEGEIFIDGVPTTNWDQRHLRRQICIVLQEPFLFNRTVRDNVALAVPGADDEDVFASTEDSSLHEVIESFEDGYDTVVGEGGVTLSGGQKQRVALARTLIRNPRIIILDDSLSAVDAETDRCIRENLKKRFGGVTVFIIAHRAGTLKEADRILVLEDGCISQQGRHDELIALDGLYKRIWDIQSAEGEGVAS
ncbi:MAG: ABC transporter ATP-binding protein [Spirochaetaceae bacterium]|nr:ABC transporter ATP-binding protein [Spirochaetaceae bacterium]